MSSPSEFFKQLDELLSLPQQMWLLGAGISCRAGIPLMHPLTKRVAEILDDPYKEYFNIILKELHENSHVEHVLSQIGDLISIAERCREKVAKLGGANISIDILIKFHGSIQDSICKITRLGYKHSDSNSTKKIGTEENPIVKVDDHINFINALFQKRRAGLERRPPVAFFTTNYDTLLEDSLALCRINTIDGFSGGSMAFWDPNENYLDAFSFDGKIKAKVYKLHGSIDWYKSDEEVVVRRREGSGYPIYEATNLLIYPQATKYQITQKDPFAILFTVFRNALNYKTPGLLAICGYSFGDEHINSEIENAMRQQKNQLTILAFVDQNKDRLTEPDQGLPMPIVKWLKNSSESWSERLVIAGSNGIYHCGLKNNCPPENDKKFEWWKFQVLTNLLINGPEAIL